MKEKVLNIFMSRRYEWKTLRKVHIAACYFRHAFDIRDEGMIKEYIEMQKMETETIMIKPMEELLNEGLEDYSF